MLNMIDWNKEAFCDSIAEKRVLGTRLLVRKNGKNGE